MKKILIKMLPRSCLHHFLRESYENLTKFFSIVKNLISFLIRFLLKNIVIRSWQEIIKNYCVKKFFVK
jgi:hypothetical protein